ncbi:MAG: aspartate carbamoyltransferase [Planctomycetaceae bacterium]
MPRSVVTIDDLTNDEVEAIFRLADRFLEEMSTPGKPYRIQGRSPRAEDRILATVFYEPSTRTRLSFESAMHRLGGQVISCPDGGSTSSAKGESIADTVRVIENYADVIVIRHSWEGAARVAADYADVPVINAGDGSHEHPTQTLCDLYTLRVGQRQKSAENVEKPLNELLKELTIVLSGDLKHGRTVHSLVYALARFGARIIPLPATEEYDFPDHVRHRLARDYNCFPITKEDVHGESLPANVLYITPEKPHQLSLWQSKEDDFKVQLTSRDQRSIKGIKGVDVFYATRLQIERKDDDASQPEYPVIDTEFLKKKPFKKSRVMHPLPRVDELSYDMDSDARGIYFQQAAYGVPVRMALMSALLELAPGLATPDNIASRYPEYSRDDGLRCTNRRCVTNKESERRYLSPRFLILDDPQLTVRCVYCDHEHHPQVISRSTTRKYLTDTSQIREIQPENLVLFANEEAAQSAGHEPRKTR